MEVYTGSGKQVTLCDEHQGDSLLKTPWDTVIHRGWVSGARENTLPAFYLVRENGYHWAECDVRITNDGVPVLSHDATITSEDGSVSLVVAESSCAQLQEIVLETSEKYGQIHMPTLRELLDMARLIGLSVLIDIKAGTLDEMEQIAWDVLGSGWRDHVVYMPQSPEHAAVIAAIDRHASFDFVSEATDTSDLPDLAPYQALLTDSNTVGFDFRASATDEAGGLDLFLIGKVLEAGLSVSFWNIRTSAYQTYMDYGPARITKQNTADAVDLDAAYLESKTFW